MTLKITARQLETASRRFFAMCAAARPHSLEGTLVLGPCLRSKPGHPCVLCTCCARACQIAAMENEIAKTMLETEQVRSEIGSMEKQKLELEGEMNSKGEVSWRHAVATRCPAVGQWPIQRGRGQWRRPPPPLFAQNIFLFQKAAFSHITGIIVRCLHLR